MLDSALEPAFIVIIGTWEAALPTRGSAVQSAAPTKWRTPDKRPGDTATRPAYSERRMRTT